MGAPEAHRGEAPKGSLRYLVVTVSTSRYHHHQNHHRHDNHGKVEGDQNGNEKEEGEGAPLDDESGDAAERMIESGGGVVVERELLPDDRRRIRGAVTRGLKRADIDVIILTGGTGVSTTDVTIETVRPLLAKEIEGFGELFRSVSYARIGAAAALSRATAGVAKGKLVMCLPGAPDGVRTALDLFLGEIPHILHLARGATRPAVAGRKGVRSEHAHH
jgi:molybdenum cofactor biosynthesis protein B